MTANTNNRIIIKVKKTKKVNKEKMSTKLWFLEVGDELHWDDCKKNGTMDEWNKAIKHFNERHNEHYISDLFTKYNLTVAKYEIIYHTDDEEEDDEEEEEEDLPR